MAAMKRGAEADEARLVDGVARTKAVALRQFEAGADVALGIEIDDAFAAGGERVVMHEIDAARVDHEPFKEAAASQRLDGAIAAARALRGVGAGLESRDGGVDDGIN